MMFAALVCCLFLVTLATPYHCEPIGPDSISRPARPKGFTSPVELKTYLDQLGQYFAVVGRPRFGKRSHQAGHQETSNRVPIDVFSFRIPATNQFRAESEDSDIYDSLYQSSDD